MGNSEHPSEGKVKWKQEKSERESSTGMDENAAAALSYVLGPVTGIIFLVIERNSKFVKFHALQSTIVFGIMWALFLLLSYFSLFLGPLILLLEAFLIVKAYRGEKYKIPEIGDLAEKWVENLD